MSVLASRFQFAPSRRAALLIGAGGAVACAALLIIPLPLPLRLPLLLLAAAAFCMALRRQALLRGARAVCGVEFLPQGRLLLLDANGSSMDMGQVAYAFISPVLCTAVVDGGLGRYNVVVMGDSLPAEEHRHFRVQLGRVR